MDQEIEAKYRLADPDSFRRDLDGELQRPTLDGVADRIGFCRHLLSAAAQRDEDQRNQRETRASVIPSAARNLPQSATRSQIPRSSAFGELSRNDPKGLLVITGNAPKRGRKHAILGISRIFIGHVAGCCVINVVEGKAP